MYVAREMTDSSLPKIGEEFSGKDHTTVMHAHERISQGIALDQNLKDAILDLKNTLTG